MIMFGVSLQYKYCPRCGHPLAEGSENGRVRPVCNECGFIHYLNPAPAAAVILFQDGQVLLVKRKYDPKAGDWSLPAGFMEYEESPQETAIRETKEETGLEVSIRRLFDVYGACDDPRSHVVLVVYVAERIGGDLLAGDDALEARFFPLDALPQNIAFSSHRKALVRFAADEKQHADNSPAEM